MKALHEEAHDQPTEQGEEQHNETKPVRWGQKKGSAQKASRLGHDTWWGGRVILRTERKDTQGTRQLRWYQCLWDGSTGIDILLFVVS